MYTPGPGPDWEHIQKYLFWAGVSFVGGILGYIMRKLDNTEKIRTFNAVMEGLSAAFFGTVIGALCVKTNMSLEYIYAIVAFCAWVGSRTVAKWLESYFRKRLDIEVEEDEK